MFMLPVSRSVFIANAPPPYPPPFPSPLAPPPLPSVLGLTEFTIFSWPPPGFGFPAPISPSPPAPPCPPPAPPLPGVPLELLPASPG